MRGPYQREGRRLRFWLPLLAPSASLPRREKATFSGVTSEALVKSKTSSSHTTKTIEAQDVNVLTANRQTVKFSVTT